MVVRDPFDAIGQFDRISAPSWNQVDGGVRGTGSVVQGVVEADVEGVWRQPREQARADFGDEIPEGLLLGYGKLVDGGDVPARHYHHVTVHNRGRVGKRDGVLALDPGACGFDGAEGAEGQKGSIL
jgi:hypothetical protein